MAAWISSLPLNLKGVWEELLSAGRGCFMSHFSAEVGAGGTGFDSFDPPKHPTKVGRQPWTPSPPDISRRLPIGERGLISLCRASLSPTLLPGLGRSSAILPGVRLKMYEPSLSRCTSNPAATPQVGRGSQLHLMDAISFFPHFLPVCCLGLPVSAWASLQHGSQRTVVKVGSCHPLCSNLSW